jgi:small-conductance mechanosensitive channel
MKGLAGFEVPQWVTCPIEVTNYVKGKDWPIGVGLLNFTQLTQNFPEYHWQNLFLPLAGPLQRIERREASSMQTIKDKKSNLQDKLRRPTDLTSEANEDSPPDAKRAVIELGDLISGPDEELDRLRSTMNTMSAAIDQIRNDNVRLASDCQKLTTELREIKLVLAKVHAKELRAVEQRQSWLG